MQRQRKVGVVQNNLVPCTTVQEHEAEDVNFLMVENPWKLSPGKMSSSNQSYRNFGFWKSIKENRENLQNV